MNFLAYFMIFIPLSTALTPNFITKRFDKYLERYNETISKRSPISVTRSQISQWKSEHIIAGKVITCRAVIDGADVENMNNLTRLGDLNATRIGQNSWSVRGLLSLSMIKISGIVKIILDGEYSNVTLPPLNIVSSPYGLIVFYFESEINFGNKYIDYRVLEYQNKTVPKFWSSIICPKELEEECKYNQFDFVTIFFKYVFVNDLERILTSLLSSVPL